MKLLQTISILIGTCLVFSGCQVTKWFGPKTSPSPEPLSAEVIMQNSVEDFTQHILRDSETLTSSFEGYEIQSAVTNSDKSIWVINSIEKEAIESSDSTAFPLPRRTDLVLGETVIPVYAKKNTASCLAEKLYTDTSVIIVEGNQNCQGRVRFFTAAGDPIRISDPTNKLPSKELLMSGGINGSLSSAHSSSNPKVRTIELPDAGEQKKLVDIDTSNGKIVNVY